MFLILTIPSYTVKTVEWLWKFPLLANSSVVFESYFLILGVFALAVCLMTMEKPKKLVEVYKPRHNDLYAPLGTAIEVSYFE